jgi:thiol-disulfide isomerase/thioredoxin
MTFLKILAFTLALSTQLMAQKAQLSGRIVDYPNQLLRIRMGEYPLNRHMCTKDSTLTDNNGSFVFKNLDITELTPVAIMLGSELDDVNGFVEYQLCGLVWLDKGSIVQVKTHKDSMPLVEIVSDLPINKDQMRLIEEEKPVYETYLDVKRQYFISKKDTSVAGKAKTEKLDFEYNWKYTKFGLESKNGFAQKNPNSPLTAHMLYSQFNSSTYDGDIKTLDSVFQLMTPTAQQTKYGQRLATKISKAKAASAGNMAANFTVVDKEGKTFSLSDYKGRFVILDFWGSWCFSCRHRHPHLRKIQEQYAKKGLEIVMFGCRDYSKERWLKAIEKDSLQAMRHVWVEYKDPSNMTTLFDVTAYPTKIIINKEGRIVARLIGGPDEGEKDPMDDVLKNLLDK